jgi:hypothetical protein
MGTTGVSNPHGESTWFKVEGARPGMFFVTVQILVRRCDPVIDRSDPEQSVVGDPWGDGLSGTVRARHGQQAAGCSAGRENESPKKKPDGSGRAFGVPALAIC